MATATFNDNVLVDNYMELLSSLSNKAKVLLATKLLDSISVRKKKKDNLDLRTCFKGDWAEGKTAEEAAEELRKSRTFNRNVEVW